MASVKSPERPTLRGLYRYQRAWKWSRLRAARWALIEWKNW